MKQANDIETMDPLETAKLVLALPPGPARQAVEWDTLVEDLVAAIEAERAPLTDLEWEQLRALATGGKFPIPEIDWTAFRFEDDPGRIVLHGAVLLRRLLDALAVMTDLRDRAVAEGHRIGAHAVQIMVDHVDPLKHELRKTQGKLEAATGCLRLVVESYERFRQLTVLDFKARDDAERFAEIVAKLRHGVEGVISEITQE